MRGYRHILGEAGLAYVAISARSGPHVTPVLFASAADRVWLLIDRRTLKARVLARRPRVGVLVESDGEALVIAGEAKLLDPLRPARLPRGWMELMRAPLAAQDYALRNAGELVGLARDAVRRPGRLRPDASVVVSVTPASVAGVSVPPARSSVPAEVEAAGFELPGIPPDVAALAARPGPAVLGWQAADGPLALPAAWDPGSRRAAVSWPRGRRPRSRRERVASVCFDASGGGGATAKYGLLLRGRARPTGDGGVVVTPARATYWTGFETATRPVA